MAQKGIRPKSINRKISSIKSFYQFLRRKQLVEKNPTLKLASLKKEKRLPETISQKDLNRLSAILEDSEEFEGVRDHLVIELLYQTGMRRSELIGLKRTDVNFALGRLKVLGKGNKERFIPLSPAILSLLGKYISVKESNFGEILDGPLIVTNKGSEPYPKFIYNIVHKNLSLVSTSKKRSPHVLRHSFATHLTDEGAELNAVKELLGHSSLAATQIYTHNSIDKLKKAYKQAHPKS